MAVPPSPLAKVLEYNGAAKTWSSSQVNLGASKVALPAICFVFLESGDWYKELDPSHRQKILAPFNVPIFLSNQACTDLNGYFGSQSLFEPVDKEKEKEKEQLASCKTWLRILTKKVLKKEELDSTTTKDYVWYEMGIFTDWNTSPDTSKVLCIGAPRDFHDKLKARVTAPGAPHVDFHDPFALLRPLIDEIIVLCDANTWGVTKLVRKIEQHRENRPDFKALRDLARHTGHITEVEQVTIETLEQLAQLQETSFQDLPKLPKSYKVQAKEYLKFQLQVFRSMRWRAQSTHDRLQEEIVLAFNVLASSDNAIMKSITLLTMFFLPGTFVAALFSTTFFSLAENGWQFSSKFWIYWATTIPVTFLVVVAWWLWLGGSYSKIRSQSLGDKTNKRLPK